MKNMTKCKLFFQQIFHAFKMDIFHKHDSKFETAFVFRICINAHVLILWFILQLMFHSVLWKLSNCILNPHENVFRTFSPISSSKTNIKYMFFNKRCTNAKMFANIDSFVFPSFSIPQDDDSEIKIFLRNSSFIVSMSLNKIEHDIFLKASLILVKKSILVKIIQGHTRQLQKLISCEIRFLESLNIYSNFIEISIISEKTFRDKKFKFLITFGILKWFQEKCFKTNWWLRFIISKYSCFLRDV